MNLKDILFQRFRNRLHVYHNILSSKWYNLFPTLNMCSKLSNKFSCLIYSKQAKHFRTRFVTLYVKLHRYNPYLTIVLLICTLGKITVEVLCSWQHGYTFMFVIDIRNEAQSWNGYYVHMLQIRLIIFWMKLDMMGC